MFTTPEEVLKYIEDEGVEFVDIRFCDLPGVMQHFNVPAKSVDLDFFTEGQAFDGSSIRGFQAIHESDMKLIPDVTTAYVDPFRKRKTLIVNFSIVDPFTDEAYSRDPRNVAFKAEAYLREHLDNLALQRLRRNKQLTPEDLTELEQMLAASGGQDALSPWMRIWRNARKWVG